MAGSIKCGPLNPPLGLVRIPSRTCGPLGMNDQGDPNVTSLLGDTPGPLGSNDYADLSLPRLSDSGNWPGSFSILSDGTKVALGSAPICGADWTPPINNQAGSVSLADAQEMALKITTVFEGGKSMNYQALADDFDGQGTSFGLIQWNFGQNTLGPLLTKMLNRNPTAFANCFGADSDYQTLKSALIANDKDSQLKWARDTIKQHRKAWSQAFKNIGAVSDFNKIQRDEAAAKYHPLVVKVIGKLREISPNLLIKIEFRTYAALFDLCVQQSGIDKALTAINSRIKLDKPKTQYELICLVVTERGKTASTKWASDCISRRLGILRGMAYSSTEHEVTKNRSNDQYHLILEFGEHYVANL
ncbi:MAG: hypothetical protein LUQ11_12500 [Methylococcaceae bacterium]|nr:hypothetical protein [Methylococcaceae bacterium]